ncbi:MAG TPA: response regulator [Blastocatellia bacterium]|nr:response regulator [Blastocatellia bacterium]
MSEMSLLIVDDSSTFRQLLSMSLAKLDGISEQSIVQAENGAEALEKVRTGNFSLVLTDINMPQMTGLELVQKVRQELNRADLPIIIISTKGSEAEVERGMQLGASGYLSKPISVNQLRDLVTGFLKDK